MCIFCILTPQNFSDFIFFGWNKYFESFVCIGCSYLIHSFHTKFWFFARSENKGELLIKKINFWKCFSNFFFFFEVLTKMQKSYSSLHKTVYFSSKFIKNQSEFDQNACIKCVWEWFWIQTSTIRWFSVCFFVCCKSEIYVSQSDRCWVCMCVYLWNCLEWLSNECCGCKNSVTREIMFVIVGMIWIFTCFFSCNSFLF